MLSSSENKLKVDLLPGQQFQLDSSMQQQHQQQQQQWVLINSSNNLSQFTNMEAILLVGKTIDDKPALKKRAVFEKQIHFEITQRHLL